MYLINRLPTPTLQNSSLFTKLNNKELDYTFLKTFGCACYPLLRPYTKHKLEFISKQCIFLGYSAHQKGYKCLDPSSTHVYVSRHVIFDELVFPAQGRVESSSHDGSDPSPTGIVLIPSHFYLMNDSNSITVHTSSPITSPSPI